MPTSPSRFDPTPETPEGPPREAAEDSTATVDGTTAEADTGGNGFDTMADYATIPRLAGLALSHDGSRLVTSVATLDAANKAWVSALWEIDPDGQREPHRLTRSAPGESSPAFAPDGRLLFTSKRVDPAADKDADPPKSALWALPAGAGEAERVAGRPGGISSFRVAADAGTVVYAAAAMPGALSAEGDAALVESRTKVGVTAILFEEYPVRHWDHDLGPTRTRLFATDDEGTSGGDADVTPALPIVQDLEDFAVSRDGRWLAASVQVAQPDRSRRRQLDLVDLVSGDQRTIAGVEGFDFSSPAFAPDGSRLVCVRQSHSTWDEPDDNTLWLIDTATGGGHDLTPDFPHWPAHPVFAADGDAVYFSSDEAGHHPVFRIDVASGSITRLTRRGAFTDLQVHPDGTAVYALRATVDAPALPVRLDASTADQDPAPLPAPGAVGELPGTLTEISTVAADGSTVRAWLVLPRGASPTAPAPLLLWIHGGPLMSWNAWSWRWNPWLMAARGYAVLLPDPALSAGYGQEFVRRGWGAWGGPPFTDLMGITDAAVGRPDIDETRTAAMGGSFGGYMANWVAGHTDRFQAIVTHASLWHLDQFSGTTDSAYYWAREFGDPLRQQERYQANSPHHAVKQIRTPMLVIHGDKDYRVPIGEALRLWYDLTRHDVESKFLFFPDENHWVLTPGNASVWYETVFAFLAQHVLGEKWVRPELV